MSTLSDAFEALDRYLKEHPHLQAYQDEIDDILDRTPGDKRQEVLGIMMCGKLGQLNGKLQALADILGDHQHSESFDSRQLSYRGPQCVFGRGLLPDPIGNRGALREKEKIKNGLPTLQKGRS